MLARKIPLAEKLKGLWLCSSHMAC